MIPEILIVGDETRRAGLLRRIRALGYETSTCAVRDLNRRVRGGPPPGTIVLCTDDARVDVVMAGLRRTRQGAAIPVVLYGKLGGEIRDLADVLDAGADHFLDEDADDRDLAAALEELAGPVREGTGTDVGGSSRHTDDDWPTHTEIIEDDLDGPARDGSDPAIGQLHRTLDMLESRLRRRDAEESERDELDLQTLGLDAVPEVDEESDGDLLDVAEPMSSRARASAVAPHRPDHTVRLSSDEAAPRDPTTIVDEPEVASIPATQSRAISDLESEGDLRDEPLPELLVRLERARFTGRMALMRGRVKKQLWFENGSVVFARSNLSQDRLVDGLLRGGKLTRAQYETARRLAAKEPRRAGEILVEAGFVKPGELPDVLRDHLQAVVESTFAWADGSFRLDEGERCSEPVRLDKPTARLVMSGIRDWIEPRILLEELDPDSYPRLTRRAETLVGGLMGLANELGVDDATLAELGSLAGRRTLRELAVAADGSVGDLPALVYALECLGFVERLGEPILASPDVDPVAVDRERIRERVDLARTADYFAVLGIGRDADRLEVRRAHDALWAAFADEQLEPETRRELGDDLATLRAVLTEARDILGDDALRSAYLAHLEDT